MIASKWLRNLRRIDDPKQTVSQGNIHQVMAYGHLFRSPRLILLYPHHFDLGGNEGTHAVNSNGAQIH